MQMHVGLRILQIVLPAALIATGCAPSIDVSTVDKFERSLAAVKQSLPAGDRARLENAVFALGMSRTRLSVYQWQLYGWSIAEPDVGLSYHIFESREMKLSRAYFIEALSRSPREDRPRSEPFNFKAPAVIELALLRNLDLDDPVRALARKLMTDAKVEPEKILDRERRGEVVPLYCGSPYGMNHAERTFSITNETKWPIRGISYGSAHYTFAPNVAPGASSESVRLTGRPGMPGDCPGRVVVEFVGHESVVTTDSADLTIAKETIEYLAKSEADVTRALQQIIDWLREIH